MVDATGLQQEMESMTLERQHISEAEQEDLRKLQAEREKFYRQVDSEEFF